MSTENGKFLFFFIGFLFDFFFYLSVEEFDPHGIADMVEVKVKLYSCRKCGIRYDSMEHMEQHHREA